MDVTREDAMLSALESVAPGTPLRIALEHVIAARTGALIVIGDETNVDVLANGGFDVDAAFTPQRLFELAKMDGAILLNADASVIRKANVHLMPDPGLATSETGMRHRTAERVSRQTDALVVAVSQRREVVSLYRRGRHVVLEKIDVVIAKANQALQTLERYRTRLDEVYERLTALEFEDLVTVGDLALVVQRMEMFRRVAREVNRHVVELGTEGRLLKLQADELTAGSEDEYLVLARDFVKEPGPRKASAVISRIAALTHEQLLEPAAIASAFGYGGRTDIDELHIRSRGYRLLHHISALPTSVTNRLVDRFGSLSAILVATEEQLDEVDGVGARRARAVRDGLRRMRERTTV